LRALVLFGDGEQSHPVARFLKPGFKHCCVVVDTGDYWVKIDFGIGVIMVNCITGSDDFDLAQYYRDSGYTVVEVEQRQKTVTFPLVARSCVGMVKQILGISAFALTPHQLYKRLRRN